MSAGENKKDVVPVLFRVTSIFIIDFLINMVWSFVVIIIFSAVLYYTNNILVTGNGMLE
jgi:hypothetical protein